MRQIRPSRLLFLVILAGGLGLAGGAAAYVLLRLIGALTNVALFHRFGWTLPSLRDVPRSPLLVLTAGAAGLVIGVMARWTPIIRGHGIPEAMESILSKQSRVAPSAAVAKPLSAAIAIGTGGPFGAEGPIIVTGGALGSLVGQLIPVSPAERKVLLAAGAAAGMSATFGTPLAAVVLAIELLLFEFSTRALIPLLVSSSVAGGVHVLVFGSGPLFSVPVHQFAGLDRLPLFAGLGVVCGLLAVVICQGLFWVEAGFRRLPIPEVWHPALGAVGFATVGLVSPRALGVGYDAIGDVLANRIAVGALAALALAKLVAWWVALGSGTSGGTLAPILLISGSVGAVLADLVNAVAPSFHVSVGAFALVAMAATFAAATRATLASIVFVFELTRDYQAILPIMGATVVADLIFSALSAESIMTEKLTRRGLRVYGDYEVDPLRPATVADVMTTELETLSVDSTVEEAAGRFARSTHNAFPIVDGDGRLAGIVVRADLLRTSAGGEERIMDLASRDVVTVSPQEPLVSALRRMLEETVEHLPVVNGERLVGICTRTDILRVRLDQFRRESPEPGWVPMWRRRPVGDRSRPVIADQ